MSFERSVIIPYTQYQKCQLPTTDDGPVDILTNDTIASDTKLKLYNQAVSKEKNIGDGQVAPPPPPPPPPPVVPKGQHILHNIPDKVKPVARSILDIIHDNTRSVDYNDNLELIIDGRPIVGSNIVNILLYLTGSIPVTSDRDIPEGSNALHNRLIELGMPSVWIKRRTRKQQPQRSSTRLAKKRKHEDSSPPPKWDSV